MGPKWVEITERCPRCEGTGTDPLSSYAACIRCEGHKTITTKKIEFPPSFLTQISPIEILASGDPRTEFTDYISVMNPEHN